MIGPGIEHLWPNAMRFAHPKADVSTDWIVHEAFGVLDTTLDSLTHLARMAHMRDFICLHVLTHAAHHVETPI